jgi:hypothetical protein
MWIVLPPQIGAVLPLTGELPAPEAEPGSARSGAQPCDDQADAVMHAHGRRQRGAWFPLAQTRTNRPEGCGRTIHCRLAWPVLLRQIRIDAAA